MIPILERTRPTRGAQGAVAGVAPDVIGDLALGLALLGLVIAATWWLLALPASYPLVSLVLYLLLAASILAARPVDLPGPGLGAANRVTHARAVLALPVMALLPFPSFLGAGAYWWIVLLGTGSMILDGADGRVARRTGTASRFGARFDMELDAALLLALSLLAWLGGKVGPWVLLIGGLRYLFVAAGWLLPALRRELPESRRRKTVCVVQGVALLVCLGPVIPSDLASAAAAAALALLLYSFALDVRWLVSAPAGPGESRGEQNRTGTAGRPVLRPIFDSGSRRPAPFRNQEES